MCVLWGAVCGRVAYICMLLFALFRAFPMGVPTHNYVRAEVTATGVVLFASRVGHAPVC